MPNPTGWLGQPTILIRHACCGRDGYPLRDHWIAAFRSAGCPLGYIIDLPRYSSDFDQEAAAGSIRVLQQRQDGGYRQVDEVDARRQACGDSVRAVAFERALLVAGNITGYRPQSRHDVFVTVCHPQLLLSNTWQQELEMVTGLADDGNFFWGLVNCRSSHLGFGQALSSSGSYELFRPAAIEGAVSRLVDKSRRQV